MRFSLVRRGAVAIAALVIAGLLGMAALPLIASTQIVKDRLASELSRWSGFRVTLGGDPQITIWPSIKATLADVRLSEWASPGGSGALTSENVEIDLSALSALRGRIVPQRVRFIRPVLRLRENGDGGLLPPAAGGRLGQAIAVATRLLAANSANPDLSRLPAEAVGTIEFVDGRLVAQSASGGSDRGILSSINGNLQWPSMNREISFRSSAIWRGENISVSGSVGAPLLVLGGGSSLLRVAVDAAPLNASFSGTIDLSHPLHVAGDATLAFPSLGRTLDWAGAGLGVDLPIAGATLAGKVTGQGQRMKIDKAELSIGGNSGRGTLELAFDGILPAVSGTLAFDNLDLLPFYSALPLEAGPAEAVPERSVIDLLNLDLRVSAARATAGPVAMADVAAAIQFRDRLVTLDISDARAFGGTVLAGFRVDRKIGTDAGEFRLLANDIDAAALAVAAGLGPNFPRARAKISLILKGPVAGPSRFLAQAGGSLTAVFSSGSMENFDLAAFMNRSRTSGFFSLNELGGGSFRFDRAELKASVEGGVAKIEKASMDAGSQRIELAGIAGYEERSLALTGFMMPVEGAPGERLAFFVGGSWESPYVSAVLPPGMLD